MQTHGPTRRGRPVLRGDQKRTIKMRERVELYCQRPRTRLANGQKGRLLGGREGHQELATSRCTTKQSSDLADLPNSTEAIPRMSSRTIVEVAHVVRFTLFFIGMDRIAILVDLFTVEGLPKFFIGTGCVNRTTHFARITRANFSCA